MSFAFLSHLENAVESLRSNRLRTLLTITGVTVGVASIVSVLSLASGANSYLSGQTTKIRDTVALIRTTTPKTSDSLLSDSTTIHLTNTLTATDVATLTTKLDAPVAPVAVLHAAITSKGTTVGANASTIVGTNQHLATIADLTLLEGDFITDQTEAGIVLGNQLAIDLFGTDQAIGNVLAIHDQHFTVTGVLKPTGQPVNFLGINLDGAAFMSLSSLKQFTENVAQIQQIAIAAPDKATLKATAKQAGELLRANHHNESNFDVLTGNAITQPASQLFSSIVILVTAVAGVSLIVGGIGIMNIMLVNVAERQREVGIRKAIGATNSHVINQFLIESCLIGLAGGILGYLIGLATAYAIGLYLPFTPALEWQVAALSIGIATITGILFGIYPAIRAAKKDPIESLRY